MFQNGGADAFKLMQDGAAFWNDSQINGYDYKNPIKRHRRNTDF